MKTYSTSQVASLVDERRWVDAAEMSAEMSGYVVLRNPVFSGVLIRNAQRWLAEQPLQSPDAEEQRQIDRRLIVDAYEIIFGLLEEFGQSKRDGRRMSSK